MHRQPDIVALGEPMYEFSACQEGPLFEVDSFSGGWGGDTANFAVAASRCGGRVGYLTRLGQDAFGESFLSLWKAEGIDARHVVLDPTAHTAVYVITRRGGRHRFTYLRRGSAASAMQPGFLPADYIRGARLLHVSGVSQAISENACETVLAAVHLAREAGRIVSYDPNFRPALWPLERAREVIHQTCRLTDLVFPSLEEAVQLTGLDSPEAIARFYLVLGPRIVVLKLGPGGALLAAGERLQHFPALSVAPVDLAGAGDAFCGAFAAAYVEGKPLDACVCQANAAAALTTTGFGCVRPIPRRQQIEALLEDRSGSTLLKDG